MKSVKILRVCFLIGLLLGVRSATSGVAQAADSPVRDGFTQDQFAVGFWVDPPVDDQMEQHYREIAEANFNLVLGGFGANTPEQIKRQLDLCQQFGMKALVRVTEATVASGDLAGLPESPACMGYMLHDEPVASEFARLAVPVAKIRQVRPRMLTFINLLPNYCTPQIWGAPSYDDYVGRFADEVKPGVLCMDHYPRFRPGEPDGRDAYCDNLAVMREQGLRAGIPFWNFFNTMPFGPHTDPTEDQLRWQIYASVTYGAKGVLYFCYYTPLSPEFPKGGAILARDGRLTRHYDQAKRLNTELKNLGPTLMQLVSTHVVRVRPEDNPAEVLKGLPVLNLTGESADPKPDFLAGEFRHADGRRAVMLQNYHFAYTAWPTVEFDAPDGAVMELDKATGKEHPVIDDSPDMDGMQLSFNPGEGRLFLLAQ